MGGCLSTPAPGVDDGATRNVSDGSRAGTSHQAATAAAAAEAGPPTGGGGKGAGSGAAAAASPQPKEGGGYQGAPPPTCEIERLAHLNSLGLLDTVRCVG